MAFSSAQRTSRHGQTHTHKQTRERIELIMQLTFVNSEYFICHESLWISKIGGEGTRKRAKDRKRERDWLGESRWNEYSLKWQYSMDEFDNEMERERE